jgi:hypothetical protein
MPNQNPSKNLLQTALKELHNRSPLKKDEQWFTRAHIGIQMKAPSHNLNDARRGALNTLVEAGLVEKRANEQGRWEFRLK